MINISPKSETQKSIPYSMTFFYVQWRPHGFPIKVDPSHLIWDTRHNIKYSIFIWPQCHYCIVFVSHTPQVSVEIDPLKLLTHVTYWLFFPVKRDVVAVDNNLLKSIICLRVLLFSLQLFKKCHIPKVYIRNKTKIFLCFQ